MREGVLKLAVVAGEVSGDLLGADLVRALKTQYPGQVELFGVGGEQLTTEGLNSLFDYSELSIMGFTQVLKKLPQLISRIKETGECDHRLQAGCTADHRQSRFHSPSCKARAKGAARPAGGELRLPQRLGVERIPRDGDAFLCRSCAGAVAFRT